jgi:hypothetical protein
MNCPTCGEPIPLGELAHTDLDHPGYGKPDTALDVERLRDAFWVVVNRDLSSPPNRRTTGYLPSIDDIEAEYARLTEADR